MTTRRGRAARLDREITEALARPHRGRRANLSPAHIEEPHGRTGRKLTINHRRIPPGDLKIAMFNASRDPDGQTFPWRALYPLAGSTVYHAGKLWTVFDRTGDGPSATVHLVGQGHDAEATVRRDDLRPITWTQRDEDKLRG